MPMFQVGRCPFQRMRLGWPIVISRWTNDTSNSHSSKWESPRRGTMEFCVSISLPVPLNDISITGGWCIERCTCIG